MDAKVYWENRYKSGGNSGYGSYNEQLTKKLNWLKGLDINSVSEIGCGDFNFGSNLMKFYPSASYVGSDISETIIKRNQLNYPEYIFSSDVPPAELLMCIDVLFHVLDDNDLEQLLNKIENKWTKYLAITAYERNEAKDNHVRIRKFDYKRFGVPLIREIVEEDGQMYFYLFKTGIDLRNVTLCLLTKEDAYPQVILDEINKLPFGEVLIGTNSDSPYRKYELFAKAKYDLLAYQDDDAICPWKELSELSKPGMINIAMKPGHIEAYENEKMTMGLGWGSIFSKSILSTLKKYTDKYGEDEVFKRETERILTSLNYPQNRLSLDIVDLPSAWAEDRLWRQPIHHQFKELAKQRCDIIG